MQKLFYIDWWNGGSWEKATHQYTSLDRVEERLQIMLIDDPDMPYRLVEITVHIIKHGGTIKDLGR